MSAGRPAAESHNPSSSCPDDVREERGGEKKIEEGREPVMIGAGGEEGEAAR